VKRSERLRSRHVSYADMVHGSFDKDKVVHGSPPPAPSPLDHIPSPSSLTVPRRASTERRVDSEVPCVIYIPPSITSSEKNRQNPIGRARGPIGRARGRGAGRRNRGRPFSRTRNLLKWKRSIRGGSVGLDGDSTFEAGGDNLTIATVANINSATPVAARGVVTDRHTMVPVTPDLVTDQDKRTPGSLSISIKNKLAPTVSSQNIVGDMSTDDKSYILSIVHRDVACRTDRRRRSQDGTIDVSLYVCAAAQCVRCSACAQLMTVETFMCHMHRRGGGTTDRLVAVTVPQKLYLNGAVGGGPNLDVWKKFLAARGKFEASAAVASRRGIPKVGFSKPLLVTETHAVVKPNTRGSVGHNSTEVVTEVTKDNGVSAVCPRHSSRLGKRSQPSPVHDSAPNPASSLPGGKPSARRASSPDFKRARLSTSNTTTHDLRRTAQDSRPGRHPSSPPKRGLMTPAVVSPRKLTFTTVDVLETRELVTRRQTRGGSDRLRRSSEA